MHRESTQNDLGGHDLGGLGRGSTNGPASSEALIDALGMAFATATLYEDPTTVEAFDRALNTLHRAPSYPWRVEVGVDGFSVHGEEVAVRREGSLRMSRGLFALGIAAVDLLSPPTAPDLMHLLDLLRAPEPPEDAREALMDAGVRTIALLDRALLHRSSDTVPDDDRLAGSGVADNSPAAFVLRMLNDAQNDPRTVARRFIEEYEQAHLLVDLDDTWGIEELIHAFVDGFWYLPEAHRAEIFSMMLERGHRDENVAFLDQFGGIELAQLNRMFGSSGHPLLSEYLRVAAEEGGRPSDGLGALVVGDPSQSLTSRIVGQVASVLRGGTSGGATHPETAVDRLAAARPDADTATRSTANVLRGLLSLAEDSEEFGSTARVWATRVTSALGADDLISADQWIDVVTGLDLDQESRTSLITALADALDGPAIDVVARLLTAPSPRSGGSAVRKTAPLFATTGLIRELGDEQKTGRRKMLLHALQVVARVRPHGLLPHLEDPRWFVVRNVVVAIGTSRRTDMAPRIEPLMVHPDHRVRIEVLRALYRLCGGTCSEVPLHHIHDAHPAVAVEACRLLGGIEDPAIDRRLSETVATGDLEHALAAITALGRRTTIPARETLDQLARKSFVFGRARRLKAAARRAMEATHE